MSDSADGNIVDGVDITISAVVTLQSTITCCPHEDTGLSPSALKTQTNGHYKGKGKQEVSGLHKE